MGEGQKGKREDEGGREARVNGGEGYQGRGGERVG